MGKIWEIDLAEQADSSVELDADPSHNDSDPSRYG